MEYLFYVNIFLAEIFTRDYLEAILSRTLGDDFEHNTELLTQFNNDDNITHTKLHFYVTP